MASKESLGRVRHFNLISQQLRLRHLRSISVRNIVPKFTISGDCLLDQLIETFFTLHADEGDETAIYTSEKIKYSLNPTWASFDPSSWSHSTAMTTFTVKVWGGQNEKFQLIIEWKVDLPSLQYLGDQVKYSKYGHNTAIFGLIDGYYGAPSGKKLYEVGNNSESLTSQRKNAIRVDFDQVLTSYNTSSLQRIQMTQKSFQQTQLSVKNVCQLIQNKVESDLKYTSQLSEEEMLTLKIKLLREELLSKHKQLLKEREEEKHFLEKLREHELNLERNKEQLELWKSSLREHKQAHIEKRESLVKLTAQLGMRRRQLISELMSIYPIVELKGTKEKLICGVRLPNSESDEFTAMDDETLAVALGYTCHVVSMIARFLQLPLRYPVNSHGSRSTIVDLTSEKVPEKDRKFPLHNRGKELAKFFYGIFLLNKNIAQIRQVNGLGTPNLRNTLPNLKDLLDTKFRASDLVKSAPLTIIRKSPLKPHKNRSSTSEDSSPRSRPPSFDNVMLQSMDATTSEPKPGLLDLSVNPEPAANPDTTDAPVRSADHDIPTNPALPDKPGKPALPDKPAKLVLLDRPAKPPIPEKPARLSSHNELVKPTLPLKPAKTAFPVQHENCGLAVPLSADQVHQTQTAERSPMATENSIAIAQNRSNGLLEGNVADHRQGAVTEESALFIPSQGTSRFLGQQRMRRSLKHQRNTVTTGKPYRTFSLKARRSNTQSQKQKLVRTGSADSTNTGKEASINFAGNTVNNFIQFEGRPSYPNQSESGDNGSMRQDDTCTSNGDQPLVDKEGNRNPDLPTHSNVSDLKQTRSDGIRSKSLFDVEGSINFDFCENGEIDLR